MIMKGRFVKKGFFQGPPMEKAIKVLIYMKLVKRNRTLVSGDTLMNSSYSIYFYLFISKPPFAL